MSGAAITFQGKSNFGAFNLSASTDGQHRRQQLGQRDRHGGSILLNASTSQFENVGTISAGSGSVTITADSIDIQNSITANGGITLQPATLTRTIGLHDPPAIST